MALETYDDPSDLYLARGPEVNEHRPLFTGDVLGNVAVPDVQDTGMAMIIAHPCSMRGPEAKLNDVVLVAAAEPHSPVGPGAWTKGYFDTMPLPDLTPSGMHVARFSQLGTARSADLSTPSRLACLSVYGVNLLQQRLIWYLTRFEVPTFRLQEAFAHTYEEADILEEWTGILCEAGWATEDAAARFEAYIRATTGSGSSLQQDLRDPQRRPAVRLACRAEARRLVREPRPNGDPPHGWS